MKKQDVPFSVRLSAVDRDALAKLSNQGIVGPTAQLRHLLHGKALPEDVTVLLLRLLDEWKPTVLQDMRLKARAVDTLRVNRGEL